jgi:hypothetical protein
LCGRSLRFASLVLGRTQHDTLRKMGRQVVGDAPEAKSS